MKKVISIAFWRISMLFVFTSCGQKVKILRVELPEYSEITVGETIEITPAFEFEGSKKEEINNEGTKENQGGVSPCDTLPNSAL